MYQYPYGNAQQLNLDWILNKLKELEAGSGATLEEVSNALIALNYAEQNYNISDIVFHNGKLYSANQNITAEPWNAVHWNEVLLANPVSNLVRYVSALNNSQVYNSSNVAGTHTSDALNNLSDAINDKINNVWWNATERKIKKQKGTVSSDVLSVDYTPEQDSPRPISSNAVYELNGAINNVQGQITANVQTSTTASRAYDVGDYFVLNGTLYRVIAAIANGATITIGTNAVSTSIAAEEVLTMPITFGDSYLFPLVTNIATNSRIRFCIPLQKPIKGWAKGTSKAMTLTINNVGNTTLRVVRAADSAIYTVTQSDISSFFAHYNDIGIGCQIDVSSNIFTNTGVAFANFPDSWTINFA